MGKCSLTATTSQVLQLFVADVVPMGLHAVAATLAVGSGLWPSGGQAQEGVRNTLIAGASFTWARASGWNGEGMGFRFQCQAGCLSLHGVWDGMPRAHAEGNASSPDTMVAASGVEVGRTGFCQWQWREYRTTAGWHWPRSRLGRKSTGVGPSVTIICNRLGCSVGPSDTGSLATGGRHCHSHRQRH